MLLVPRFGPSFENVNKCSACPVRFCKVFHPSDKNSRPNNETCKFISQTELFKCLVSNEFIKLPNWMFQIKNRPLRSIVGGLLCFLVNRHVLRGGGEGPWAPAPFHHDTPSALYEKGNTFFFSRGVHVCGGLSTPFNIKLLIIY